MKKIFCLILLTGCFVSGQLMAQRAGDSVRVDYGTVVGIQHVKLASNAGRGATLGGLAGLAASHGDDRRAVARKAAAGAVLGALIASAAQRNRDGTQFTIELRTGSEVSYITEQRDIQMHDCVAVEQADHVNLRRVADAMCENHPDTTEEYHAADVAEAVECQQAKNSLLAAETETEANAAGIKVQILCHH